MMVGMIISINAENEYGFIQTYDGEKYYFDKKDVMGPWQCFEEGREVIFSKSQQYTATAINVFVQSERLW